MIFSKRAIIFLLINYCSFLFSQSPSFTKEFECLKNNVPIKIINAHPNYFFVLRYNKAGHDFTIEKRNKPDAKVLAFTPLKLDSVNANWFDYENLDYLFFNSGSKLYFVFQKILNSKQVVYIKEIDSSGKSTGFRELAVQEADKGIEGFNFVIKTTAQNNLLIVSEQNYNGIKKKLALYYDPVKNLKNCLSKIRVQVILLDLNAIKKEICIL